MKNWRTFWQTGTKRLVWLYGGAAALVILAAAGGILYGSTSLSVGEAVSALLAGEFSSAEARILLYVRLPRVLGGLLCGGALAAAGAAAQGVLGNRLASPATIGVNAGAALAVTVCGALGLAGGMIPALAAFGGAFLAAGLIGLAAGRWGASEGTVILLGAALNSLLGAISDGIVTLWPEVSVLSADFRSGNFSGVSYARLLPAAALILPALVLLCSLGDRLDVLGLGEENARGLGMNTSLARVTFLLLTALLAGAAVSVAGLVSFVGLLVPHGIRRLGGGAGRHLLPLCVLTGGGFVSLCDTAARVVFAPYELPVGIVLALLGAPCFVWILLRRDG